MNTSKQIFIFIIIMMICEANAEENSINACLISYQNSNNLLINSKESTLLSAGSIEGQLGKKLSIKNEIKVTSGDNTIIGGEATFDENGGIIRVTKNLIFENPNAVIYGKEAIIETEEKTALIQNSDYQIYNIPARGIAKTIAIDSDNNFKLTDFTYTTCTALDNSWELRAQSMELNKDEGMAKNLSLRFKDWPILYLPYLTFPLSDSRKSGILPPNFGSSTKRGLELSLPYYWNISTNMDLKTTPKYMDKRGFQLSNQFRFMTKNQRGETLLDFLPNDKQTDKDRTYISHEQVVNLSSDWKLSLKGEYASGNNYFEDLTQTLSSTSRTHLVRSINLDHFSNNWFLNIGMDNHQIINDVILFDEKPHKRLPYLNFTGLWSLKETGINYGLNGQLAYFDKSGAASGGRFHMMPNISKTFNLNGIQVKPALEIDITKYNLDKGSDEETSRFKAKRTVPIYSLDVNALLKKSWSNQSYQQTIEPRIMAVYIPFHDQNDFPVFDTIQPDINHIQLFRKNRYIGQDRIGDTSKLSYGITTKLFEKSSLEPFMSLTLGQTHYYKERKVTLPNELVNNNNSSAYLAMMKWNISKEWSLRLGHMWASDIDQSMKTETRLQYKSNNAKIFNFSYRYRRDMLRQFDTSFSIPIRDSWNIVGRYNYSIIDKKVFEQFVGVEYETCCWGIRAVSRKHLAYRNGESDSSFSIQFIFKGLGEIGMPIENLLDRGILGYDGTYYD